MTDENVQSEQNAENASSQPAGESAPSQSAKKPRSSTEKLVVRGLIGALILFVAVEAHAKFSYDSTRASLKNVFENDEKGETVTVAELDGLLKGFETRSDITKEGSSYVIECRWMSLVKNYTINIYVSEMNPESAELLSYSTPASAAEVAPITVSKSGRAGGKGKKGGGGFSFSTGGLKGGGGHDPRTLMGRLANEAVQVEVSLTDEQKARFEASGTSPGFSQHFDKTDEDRANSREERRLLIESKVKSILTEEQFVRVRQLMLQETGLSAVEHGDVKVELKLTDEQNGKIFKIIVERIVADRELGRRASAEDRQKFSKEWDAKIAAVLTSEQKEIWEKLLGPPPVKAETTAEKAESTDENAESTDENAESTDENAETTDEKEE